jgi:hypothetical protein
MLPNFRKYVAFSLSVIALFVLGAIFYSLVKSGAGSTGPPAFSTAAALPDTVDHHPTQTSVPYPLASPGLAYLPPSMHTPIPYPYPLSPTNATATALIALNETYVAFLAKTMTAEPTSNIASQTALVEQRAAYLNETIKEMKALGAIMLDDNGRTYTYTLTTRFFVFLDDEKYPVASMDCVPQWVIGSVSSGSLRGRDLYPIYYDASIVGSCTLKNHDFAVKIVVVDIPTPAPAPP